MNESKIIAGFPGVGKTYLSNKFPSTFNDADSSKFSWESEGVRHPDFPANYTKHLCESAMENDVTFCSTHKVVLDDLIHRCIAFTLIYPKRGLKEIYLARYASRGDNEGFINLMNEKWDSFIDDLEGRSGCSKYELEKQETIEDLLEYL